MKRNHILALLVVVVVVPLLVHSIGLMKSRAANAVDPAQESVRGFLDQAVTARAQGRGNPWITLRDGSSASSEYQGASKLNQQLQENVLRPQSVGSADFDEDGVPDLVAGYAGTKSGLIGVHRGDGDTIFPNTSDAIVHRLALRANEAFTPDSIQSPFFVDSRTFDVLGAPDFLGTGDFDGDGHQDVVTAEVGGGALVLLSGDGHGGFAASRSFALPGKVTTMATGEVNRMDGLADIIVAVNGTGTPKVLVYEGPEGALKAEPEVIALPAEARSIALGQLDGSFPVDYAVAAGRELLIIRGRDRKLSTGDARHDAGQPVVTRVSVSSSISSVAIGDFTGDLRREIAALSDDGICQVFASAGPNSSIWQKATSIQLSVQKPASTRVIVTTRISTSPKDDLLVLDQTGRQVQIVVNELATITDDGSKAPGSLNLLIAGAIDFEDEPVAVLGMRLNSDAINDLVVLRSGASAPTVIMSTPAATFTVTNTNDDLLPGSLRKAITDANGNPGADMISFSIPGAGTQTISPSSSLPGLTGPVTLDGTTQSPGSPTPPIELDGNNAGIGITGLSVSGNSSIRGLAINRFDGAGIALLGSGTIVSGNFIGTDAAGTGDQGNGETGVLITSPGSGHTIGGTVAAARNVISGNTGHGVQVLLGLAMNHLVQGNFIGTNASGSGALANDGDGVEMLSGEDNIFNCTIGGTTAGAGNVISANSGTGVQFITVGTSNLVQGNLIGTDATGTNDLGNGGSGVALTEANDSTIGGTVSGAGNVISGNGAEGIRLNSSTSSGNLVQGNRIGTRSDGITPLQNGTEGVRVQFSASNNTIGGSAAGGNTIAFNLGAGVLIDSGTGNRILSNSIFSNGLIGIDLGTAGVTPNDAGDGDGGANTLQNFPVLTTSNGVSGGGVNVQGTLNSTASTTFTLEFFSNASCDPSGNGEGRTFLGSAPVTTNAAGNVAFNVNVTGSAVVGESITATATNPQGNTSEFSNCVTYGAADLGVMKTASAGTIATGSNVTYTITVSNSGPDPASSVTVTDTLPAAVTFVSCVSTGGGVCGGSGNNRSVTFNTFASGASATITFVATLNCTVANGLVVGNTATVTSPVRDPSNTNNAASVNFTASNPPRTILPTSQGFTADGGTGSVNVTAPAGCGWQATTNEPWITITSGASGTGNGVVEYVVSANGTGIARMGIITIAGLTFTVNQSNVPCSYSINPGSASYPAAGGAGSVTVTTQFACLWKAFSNDSWIVVTPGTDGGAGSGSVSYTVAANPDTTPRTGSLDIANHTFTIMQAAAPCPYAIEPKGRLFTEIGDEGDFALTTTAECEWTVSSNDQWIFITSAESGSGPTTVTYGVLDNPTGSPRQGSISIGNLSFTIVQDGGTLAECIYVLRPTSTTVTAAGGNGSVQVLTEGRCAWEARPLVNWITISSEVVGIGTSTISYDVKPNPLQTARVGIVMIGGQQFKVKQKGGS